MEEVESKIGTSKERGIGIINTFLYSCLSYKTAINMI